MYYADRLRLARERRGLTMSALAKEAGITARSLSTYENSDETFIATDNSMQKIADALNYPIQFFQCDGLPELEESSVSFRALTKLSAKKKRAALAAGKLARELSLWIENQFQLPVPSVPSYQKDDYIEPHLAAQALREEWGLGQLSISNMVHLLESKGVRVFSLAENCLEVDAFSFWQDDVPYIILNTMKSPERSRFDAAHELAHLVLHKHGLNHGVEAEREADQFASAFLMPDRSVKAALRNFPTLDFLIKQKKLWKVSLAALVRRSHDLGFSSEWHYRQLSIDLSRKGYRTKEPEGIDQRESSLVLLKVSRMLQETPTILPENIFWPTDELRALTFNYLPLLSSLKGQKNKASIPPNETKLTLVK